MAWRIRLILPMLALLALGAQAQDAVRVPPGVITGQEFLALPQQAKSDYSIGFVEGLFMSPVMGAPETRADRLSKCLVGMNSKQIAAIFETFLRKHPERWHQGMSGAAWGALKGVCDF